MFKGVLIHCKTYLGKSSFLPIRIAYFFLGDVVNRGDKSLTTLRFIKGLGDNAKMILGNHDFHLLTCALTSRKPNSRDTFTDIINADDRNELIDFLLKQPLAIEYKDVLLVHAGIPPAWDQDILFRQTTLVQKYLQGNDVSNFFIKHVSQQA